MSTKGMLDLHPERNRFKVGDPMSVSDQIEFGMLRRISNIASNNSENLLSIKEDVELLQEIIHRLEDKISMYKKHENSDGLLRQFYDELLYIMYGIDIPLKGDVTE